MADQAAIDKVVGSLHWLGHDSFRLDSSQGAIYFDPYEIKQGPEAALILVSHDHFDHCVPEDVAKIQGEDTVILTESDSAGKLTGKVKALVPGQEVKLGKIKVNTVPAYNLDKEFHPRANEWLGFILTVDGVSIYHAGDTDYIPEMDHLRVDVALLPVSGTYVMTSEEAVRAAQAIGPKVAIPMHYGAIVGDDNDAKKFAQALEGMVEVRILPKEE
ncbi:MAG: MBL fold metallo-hydrolase [Desulfarculaceae bacterium]|nr:MBL fold metallo-hydrolase [Desulfarculaceae bacterium]MCF8071918.1 MBL fold metallo-hydrolase [Desulfarculaceae bacterium]MCF8103718.1 MBL fold metallo-hydrolase [Desulfarculaceae bacterium]MCF8114985.1 MBL fold metallo-hydrolase [Desulfarculaceae bacterium]